MFMLCYMLCYFNDMVCQFMLCLWHGMSCLGILCLFVRYAKLWHAMFMLWYEQTRMLRYVMLRDGMFMFMLCYGMGCHVMLWYAML